MALQARLSRDGRLCKTDRGWRLEIPAGDDYTYRLSQLDDQGSLHRSSFAWYPPFRMSLRARVANLAAPGTWGFGLWNSPFAISLGLGGRPASAPALPRAAWFFHSSPRSHLSFRDDMPGFGFLAQTFAGEKTPAWLIFAGLMMPFAPRVVRRLLGRLIREDSARVMSDPSQWHEYAIEWSRAGSAFWVDDVLLLRSPVSPAPPLAMVIWVDNQFGAFDPLGRLRWGTESNTEDAWLMVEDIQIQPQPSGAPE